MNRFKFKNKLDQAVTVYLEPWGDDVIVPPVAELTIDIVSTKQGLLETHLEEGVFTIWLWAGCRIELSINGEKQIRPWHSIPVPG